MKAKHWIRMLHFGTTLCFYGVILVNKKKKKVHRELFCHSHVSQPSCEMSFFSADRTMATAVKLSPQNQTNTTG